MYRHGTIKLATLFLAFASFFGETCLGAQKKIAPVRTMRASPLVNYYDPIHLQELNKNNNGQVKHAPLLIFSDGYRYEQQLFIKTNKDVLKKCFSIMLHDIINSNFHPLILINHLSLSTFLYDFEVPEIAQNYLLFDVPQTQFVLLIPHWFFEFYRLDHGLRLEYFKNKSSLLQDIDKAIFWLNKKKSYQIDTDANAQQKSFATDLASVFSIRSSSTSAPMWDIIFLGHGNKICSQQSDSKIKPTEKGAIGGLSPSCFINVLDFFATQMNIGTLYLLSCYGGGVNANYINSKINSKLKTCPFHFFIGSSGDSQFSINLPKILSNPSLLQQAQYYLLKPLTNYLGTNYKIFFPLPKIVLPDRFLEIMQKFFTDAAMLSDSSKQSFYDLGQNLIEMHSIAGLSLHGSQNVPLVRKKEKDRFKCLNIDPRFVAITKKENTAEITLSNKTRVIFFDTSEVNSLKIEPFEEKNILSIDLFKVLRSSYYLCYEKKEHFRSLASPYFFLLNSLNLEASYEFRTLMAQKNLMPSLSVLFNQISTKNFPIYAQLRQEQHDFFTLKPHPAQFKKEAFALASLCFPEFLIFPKNSLFGEYSNLHINKIELISHNKLAGIHKFFLDTFLASINETPIRITIDELSGIDDISLTCELTRLFERNQIQIPFEIESLLAAQKKSTGTDIITLKKVIINRSDKALNLSFFLMNTQFTASCSFSTNNLSWEFGRYTQS